MKRARAAAAASAVIAVTSVAACGDDLGAPPDVEPTRDAASKDAPGVEEDGAVVDATPDAPVGPVLPATTRFVLLGDFGFDDANEAAVAAMIKAYQPEIIVTLGDNNYPDGAAATIDETIGKYYSDFIFPYVGKYGKGATTQRFYACLGNHEWNTGSISAHLDYFTLPNNERYWEIVRGPVRILCVDSDDHEPDGTTADSVQGKWLQARLLAAKDPFRLVVFHHPPHSSGQHGSQAYMQWPFEGWGASAVYAGHDHDYERFDFGAGSIPFVVQGLGGADLRPLAASRAGSVFAYSEKHGATFVETNDFYADFAAITVDRDRIDEHVLVADAEAARTTDTFIAAGSTVRYLDVGAPPAGWNATGFDVGSWKSGAAPLGYGQGGEQTTLATGLSHYFVARFDVADPSTYHHAVVWLRRDDGAAVYVNGQEMGRSNLPSGPLGVDTLASTVVGFQAEAAWVPVVVPSGFLRAGANVVAVELHQSSPLSSDATFDLRVEGKR